MHIIFLLLLFNIYCIFPAFAAPSAQLGYTLNVLASPSLSGSLSELLRDFSQKHHKAVSVTYDVPAHHAESISSGEPADVVLVDDEQVMKALKQQGLIDVQSVNYFARNHLVLASRKDSISEKKFGGDTPLPEILSAIPGHSFLVIADSSQTAMGRYSEAVLRQLGFWRKLSPFILRGESELLTARLVSQGQGVGIIYASDAANDPNMVVLGTIPAALYPPLYYQGAAVAGNSMNEAREFLNYLKQPYAQSRFRSHGLVEDEPAE